MRDCSRMAVLIPEFPGQTHIFFWREIQALREAGNHVEIISTRKPRAKNFHEFFSQVSDTYYLTKIPIIGLIAHILLNLPWLMRSVLYCFRLQASFSEKLRTLLFIPLAANLQLYCKAKKIGHIHVHSSADASHIVAIGALAGKFTYSVCIHGNLNQYGRNHLEKLSGTSAIITVTEPLRSEILDALPNYPEDQVHVVPMGVNLSKFLPRTYAEFGTKPIVLTSVSRLAHVKGHTYTLQALAQLPENLNFIYQIVGDGEMREKLEQEVNELGLTDKVVFLGFKKEQEVNKILKTTDIFVLTSFGFGEAAPVAIMEAMACGVATVCSIIGGTRDMITDGYDGILVRQKDVEDIKRAILFLLENSAQIKAISENARATAEEKFCHRRVAHRLAQHIIPT
ncbi:glycosyltransferase family 4 protein [Microbulbifer agarilyticus]|uniref:glycosyltransferase family 4 protein n=1 Tax=Microbulbifer agarilyticus TaxID=260552 RepID=UPI001C984946|nr:glycosyltransferase family 4 protein [Microbulbifer agarilyticus]MBY6211338.1 glycosyltransferase family 4 protein [Microbulbifer agarilyticus]